MLIPNVSSSAFILTYLTLRSPNVHCSRSFLYLVISICFERNVTPEKQGGREEKEETGKISHPPQKKAVQCDPNKAVLFQTEKKRV